MSDNSPEQDKDLDEFAQRIAAAIPEFPDAALERVRQKMEREIEDESRPRSHFISWRGILLPGAVAALLLVGALLLQHRDPPDSDRVELEQPKPGPSGQGRGVTQPAWPAVEDQLTVVLAVPSSPKDQKPLIQLADYQSLIGDTP